MSGSAARLELLGYLGFVLGAKKSPDGTSKHLFSAARPLSFFAPAFNKATNKLVILLARTKHEKAKFGNLYPNFTTLRPIFGTAYKQNVKIKRAPRKSHQFQTFSTYGARLNL
ncbi:MAG: hypothetical protein IJ593_03810 [Lachnospiraceae bacterium]|nr:hypothetical protein [Lachnospiraceae bacterium]